MKKYLFLSILTLLLASSGCEESLEEINVNPNQPENVTPDLLLPQVIYRASNQIALAAWNRGNVVAQYTAKINFTDFDRYNWGSEDGFWETMYSNMRDVENLIQTSRQFGNTSYEAMALVYKSWMFANLTDNYGNVPYLEATKGKTEGLFTPVYDSQEDIYNGILADLSSANDLFKNALSIPGGDLLYDGDILQWRKLTNSLRIRYLMRISNKQDISSELNQLLNEPIFEGNEDNGVMEYLSAQPNTWPVHTYRVGSFDEYRLSHTLEDKLKAFNDERLLKWFRPTDATIGTPDAVYSGMPNGLSENNASTYNGGALNVSRCGTILYEEPNSVDAIVMCYSELQFILAEAAQRGLISGDAKTYYENGIKASFEYWDISQDPDAYINQPGVAYDGELETIINQKWISLFLTGFEGWYDFRRTGFPSEIVAGPDNVNSDLVPVRFLYPEDQQALNGDNYENNIQIIGEDNINVKGWWESN